MKTHIITIDSIYHFFIEHNYSRLKNELLNANSFVEDVFQQSLLDIRDELLFDESPSLALLDKSFRIFYKINTKSHYNDKNQYVLFESSIIELIISKKIDYGTDYL